MFNPIRMTGLASGVDTEEMIQSLMRVERIKVDRVEQDRQVLLWRQEAYNNLNKSFANFIMSSRRLFDLTRVSRTGTFLPNSHENLNWVKKATSSDETIATVSSSSKVMDGNYDVEVEQLAEGVTAASGSDIRWEEGQGGLVNKDGKIVDNQGKLVEELKFTINAKDFSFSSEDGKGISMNDIVKEINQANVGKDSIGVRASYDSSLGRFFLQTTATGKEAEIKINATGDINEAFIEDLKLNVSQYDDEGNKETEELKMDVAYTGRDAKINFNGADNITSSSNRITVNGITMELRNEGNFNVNVATDVDGIYEKIEEFVNEYNKLVEETSKLLGEKQHRDYRPLTAEQRKEMDREDIELWEEKAKSGLLRSDELISRTMYNIRRSLYEKSEGEFTGPYDFLTKIGLSTAEYERGTTGGKLAIDETRLKKALSEDPEGVMELLFKPSNKENGEIGGLVTRIHENLMEGMEDIIKRSGTGGENDLYRGVKSNMLIDFVSEYGSISTLDKDVLQFSRRIDDLNAMLFRKENSYYAKFSAMETAIARMNEQSMWMMQQFMG